MTRSATITQIIRHTGGRPSWPWFSAFACRVRAPSWRPATPRAVRPPRNSRFNLGWCSRTRARRCGMEIEQLPNRGECLFRIARLGPDMADIVTEDGTVRGWVKIDEILPLEAAADHFSRRIAAAPGDSEAYQIRGADLDREGGLGPGPRRPGRGAAAGPRRPAKPPPAGPVPGPEEGAREGDRRVLRAPSDWTRPSPSPSGTGGSPGMPGGSSTRRSPT